jgi:hypothetical protein
MPAPTSDVPSGSATGDPAGHRRRRGQLVLVVSALVVLATAVGVSLAIATRPIARPAPAAAGAVSGTVAADQNASAGRRQTAAPEAGAGAEPAAEPESSTAPAAAGAPASDLEDGDHEAYITKIDRARHRLVVDVVQVFHDDAAVKAAIADGKSPSDAKYLTTWVRNQNPRLRILPLAEDPEIELRDACGESGDDPQALLAKLAANARLDGTYYYTLTVDHGAVERIQERLAVNAC